MNPPNGKTNGSAINEVNGQSSVPPVALAAVSSPPQYTPEQVREFVALLEVPFDSSVIDWRVTNTTKDGSLRGLVIPYADQRAYTDRLNALFSPSGWTRKYAVHTSANFQRDKDQKTVAKVFVTCELTVFGIGSHSATGEEWADDQNAGTAAEAQAFKRACCCFGLGRYLYYFSGFWVDLDSHRRPRSFLMLPAWATPEGWRAGLRPNLGEREPGTLRSEHKNGDSAAKGDSGAHDVNLVSQIEAMAEPLGRGLYRGLLKTIARVWQPAQIGDSALLKKVLEHMQAAERGLRRLDQALNQADSEAMVSVLRSMNLKSFEQVTSLETLKKVVVAVEARVKRENSPI
ncbi:MAG TPA: Rad52/Rad22 family DNA repair protein [Candidatus Sulfotelmatobacter sp.]|nr:Rad52/Rad22 family DNA repair protein [Candidatus Sulfotelmatobacter sp.]